MNNNLTIELHSKEDSNQKTYYVGRLQAPMTLDFKDGVTFLIFVSENGEEELQICASGAKNQKPEKYNNQKSEKSAKYNTQGDEY